LRILKISIHGDGENVQMYLSRIFTKQVKDVWMEYNLDNPKVSSILTSGILNEVWVSVGTWIVWEIRTIYK
jgi:hypothetical protein